MDNVWRAVGYFLFSWVALWGLRIMFFDFFIRRSEYDSMQCAYEVKTREYFDLLQKWNLLVAQVNARGGLAYLNKPPPAAITQNDIKVLLQLCHPDKHQGRQIAQEMTAKLLAMREKL